MNYRITALLGAEAASTAGTKTLDINLAEPVSRITVQMKGLNNLAVPTAHPAKMVSKIEVVDGSDVLVSLSGVQAQALNYYNKGRMPLNVVNYMNDVYSIATYDIDFGRWLYDELLALDPRKFTNPQLKITHNMASGGSAPDAGELSVYAHTFDEKAITPTGFLTSKEQYEYSLTASATENIDLAVDKTYRALMILAMSATLQPWEQFNQVKLSQDNDRKVIINDEKTSNLLKLLTTYPPFTENITGTTKNGTTTFYCAATYERVAVLVGLAADADAYITDTYGGAINVADSAAAAVNIAVTGYSPHSSLFLPFGKQDAIEDWFKMDNTGSLRLSLKAGASASGTGEIVSQQLRLY